MLFEVTSLLLANIAGLQEPSAIPPDAPTDEQEIVVTGRSDEERNDPDAVEALEQLCFDPARLMGSPVEPTSNSHWFPLDQADRKEFKLERSQAPAYSLYDDVREHELWLKIEELEQPHDLVKHRCTILVLGGKNHDRFIRDLSEMFGGKPTQRHVGHPDGTAALSGWEQWLWTGMPNRRSKQWRSNARKPTDLGQKWTVVTDPASFYRRYNYIYGDLKIRNGGTPLSLIRFGFVKKR